MITAKTAKNFSIKTLYGNYKVRAISNRPEKGYTVTVPKLRGVVTHGDSIAEAKKMVKEAIELYGECLFAEGMAEIKVVSRPKVLA